MNKQLSRKYILAWAALMSLNANLALGLIDGSLWLTGVVATVGAYLTANVAEGKKV